MVVWFRYVGFVKDGEGGNAEGESFSTYLVRLSVRQIGRGSVDLLLTWRTKPPLRKPDFFTFLSANTTLPFLVLIDLWTNNLEIQ